MTSTPQTRKFERITGIPAIWTGTAMVALKDDNTPWFWAEGGTAKMALDTLLRDNLKRISDKKVGEGKGQCERCGRRRPLSLHHTVYRSTKRDDREENLEIICEECHGREHRQRK